MLYSGAASMVQPNNTAAPAICGLASTLPSRSDGSNTAAETVSQAQKLSAGPFSKMTARAWSGTGTSCWRRILNMTIAFMSHGGGKHVDEARASLAASAPALLAALVGLVQHAQPINWDDSDDPDQAEAWRAAVRAMHEATGIPVPASLCKQAGADG